MARQKPKRRSYVRRAGLLAAAKELGCDYSHLRRVVSGERTSRALANRYRSWKRSKQPQPPTPHIEP